jgi:hypothetical protein
VLRIVEERLRIVPDGDPAIPEPDRPPPICALLDKVLAPANPLHAALRAIVPELTWYLRPGSDDRFRESHANTMLVGWSRARISGSGPP